jgi:phosphate/sulfate permease
MWYARQNQHGDALDEAKYPTWAVMSLVGTAIVIAVESTLYIFFSVSLIMYSSFNIPRIVSYAWSFPMFLILNYYFLLRKNQGFRSLVRFRNKPKRQQTHDKIIGLTIVLAAIASAFISMHFALPVKLD